MENKKRTFQGIKQCFVTLLRFFISESSASLCFGIIMVYGLAHFINYRSQGGFADSVNFAFTVMLSIASVRIMISGGRFMFMTNAYAMKKMKDDIIESILFGAGICIGAYSYKVLGMKTFTTLVIISAAVNFIYISMLMLSRSKRSKIGNHLE